ncbi:hypothetical protein [Streptomyces bottropensis]|uniref:hypothetical protein n=1 Tax=Streptomyces bottropensis TaxID=42235 RepID=UPI003682436F
MRPRPSAPPTTSAPPDANEPPGHGDPSGSHSPPGPDEHAPPRPTGPGPTRAADQPEPHTPPTTIGAPDPAVSPSPVRDDAGGDGLDTLYLGSGTRIATAVTWLRPQGYVEWEGVLRRAHWHGPADAFPQPGSPVRITVTTTAAATSPSTTAGAAPLSDPPVLDARPLR